MALKAQTPRHTSALRRSLCSAIARYQAQSGNIASPDQLDTPREALSATVAHQPWPYGPLTGQARLHTAGDRTECTCDVVTFS